MREHETGNLEYGSKGMLANQDQRGVFQLNMVKVKGKHLALTC